MLMKISEFFKNLPRKKCTDCGKEIEEQHECYGNKCNNCLGVTFHH
ncbi:protein YhfH [Anoxybacteroides amylolyticum]|uniref:YhfH-like family protein n=1 Tax=Anoxybacteroides amylolyticum TaxID=294699 RepID=A0A160F4A6_9BACL|nr:protein YhfH [Anoxybacillus amylolyticus]ANB60722.1 yhfH-like family protein [Anoxybacillus amylolyticus]